MDQTKLTSALRGIECDLERIELAISHDCFARKPEDPEKIRAHRALTGQYKEVLAKLTHFESCASCGVKGVTLYPAGTLGNEPGEIACVPCLNGGAS